MTRPEAAEASTRRRWRRIGAAAGILASVLVLGALDVPLCPWRSLLGVPCPGCGLSRATLALLLGDVRAALYFHPLVIVIAPLAAVISLRVALASAGLRVAAWLRVDEKIPSGVWVALIVAMLVVWAVRLGGGLGGHPDGLRFDRGLATHWLATVHDRGGAAP